MRNRTLATCADVQRALRRLARPNRAAASARFFKCGAGEYGEGDRFIGVTVPQLREAAKRAEGVSVREAFKLLRSRIHEDRAAALLILVRRCRDENVREQIRRRYLRHVRYVSNWDLVDMSAEYIVGNGCKPALLDELAGSKHLWSRRIAIIATFHHIKRGSASETLRIAETLVADEHDLIHKAVGWMLREVSKRVGPKPLRAFLRRHAASMPRTMLRYAIEHLPAPERKRWMGVGRPGR